MKQLTSLGLALLLATGGATALADRGYDDHHGGHGKGHHKSHHKGHKYGHHKGHWYPRPYYPRGYYYPRHHHDHHDQYGYYPLGAALIGAAVTYSIFHTHGDSYSASSGSTEVVGCHRIERYPDGSERRVEVPISECY